MCWFFSKWKFSSSACRKGINKSIKFREASWSASLGVKLPFVHISRLSLKSNSYYHHIKKMLTKKKNHTSKIKKEIPKHSIWYEIVVWFGRLPCENSFLQPIHQETDSMNYQINYKISKNGGGGAKKKTVVKTKKQNRRHIIRNTYCKAWSLHQGHGSKIHSVCDITSSPYARYVGARELVNLIKKVISLYQPNTDEVGIDKRLQ